MNKQVTAIVATATLVAVAIIYIVLDDRMNSADISADLIDNTTSEAGRSEPHNAKSLEEFRRIGLKKFAAPENSSRAVTASFEAATSAAEAIEAIEQAHKMGDTSLANFLEDRLYKRCQYFLGEDDFEIQYVSKWAYNNMSMYCSNYISSLTSEELLQRAFRQNTKISFKASQLFQEYLEMKHEDAESDFVKRFANVTREEDMLASIDLLNLLEGAGIPLSLGQDVNSYSRPIQALNVKQNALQLYSCYRFGGCGPDGFITQQNCVITRICEPGWSMYDYYANTMSPIDFDLMVNIFIYLFAQQTDG